MMNTKAAFAFTMAGLSAVGAALWFNDGLRALRGDVWPDAMRSFSVNGSDNTTTTTTPTNVTIRPAEKDTD